MLDPWVKIQSHMKHGANYEPCHSEDLFMVTLWCETGAGRCGIYGKGVAGLSESRNTDKPSPLEELSRITESGVGGHAEKNK